MCNFCMKAILVIFLSTSNDFSILPTKKKCFGVVFKTVLKTSLEPVMSHNQYFNICFDCQFLQNRLENVFLIAFSPVIKQYFFCVLRQNNRSFCGLFPSSLDVDQKSRKSVQFLIYPPSFYFKKLSLNLLKCDDALLWKRTKEQHRLWFFSIYSRHSLTQSRAEWEIKWHNAHYPQELVSTLFCHSLFLFGYF